MSVFAEKIIDPEWGNYFELKPAGYVLIILVMIAALLLGSLLSGSGKSGVSPVPVGAFRTKRLVFSAVAMALAYVTSFIKLADLPMGGSVTLLSMFFICLVGYWYGLGTGLLAAVAYGCLQLVTDPYIISIPQMLMDYILAFGALGLSGLFSEKKHGLLIGYLTGVAGRFVFSFLSGMIFFGSYAADYNMAAPLYSFVYNGAYLGLEALITVVVIMLPPVAKALRSVKNTAIT